MIGLDTNVLVRYITQDDPKQAPKANRLLDSLTPESPGFVPLVVVVELVWVLSACYGFDRQQLVHTLDVLLRTRGLVVENAELVLRAVRIFKERNADFPDCLIERAAAAAGCVRTVTFDTGAIRCAGMAPVE